MEDWIIMYTLDDGYQGEVITPAVNRMMAWDTFTEIAKENGWNIVQADCCKLSSDTRTLWQVASNETPEKEGDN